MAWSQAPIKITFLRVPQKVFILFEQAVKKSLNILSNEINELKSK